MTGKRSKGELKRLREQETVSMMIRLYCRKNHVTGDDSNGSPGNRKSEDVDSKRDRLCPECRELLNYAEKKIQRCPFMALHHLWCTLREKKKEAKRHD